ncbi:MAG: 2 protein, partial [Verrucomicrobiota bacterium]|nr:2 protein [Verrucomicrobiota bacterium]
MDRLRGRLTLLAVAAAAAAYTFFIAWYHAPYAGGSDSSGYLNSARLLLAGRLTAPLTLPPELPPDLLPRAHFAPLGYSPDPRGPDLLPSYPVGLPLHFAAAGSLIGLRPATTLVAVLSALGLVGLLYLTALELGVRPGWAAGLAAGAGLSPLTLFYALQPMSDLVAATWTVLAMLAALRSARHAGWALAAGAAFAVSVLVRPTNLLLVLPALVALAPNRRAWLAFVAGGLPFAAFLACYNHALYGRILTTGYGDVSSLFAGKNFLT